ncbi:hypothetical protein HANVADRAFT_22315 [Hanseniaspora valbyensis NRRL Y-1626]|uniref:GPN-loop GTPase 2 n=1 Tax=Hanseniaspora valbyensis NRRL Y-1626 TaxID=766949 RepID=A0A1B7TH93_9ASCO|nr:hypothetical protein HANVADRAFT_22315 [Hanseniaspora valbyensis NRRL Y-1626]
MPATFGQVVIGPPGSGKSTYCNGLQQFYNAIGRSCCIINLDPANDRLPYSTLNSLDIRDYLTIEEIMEEQQLGPNGGLIYCLESMEESLDIFYLKIQDILKENENTYLIFDCPGQIELFTSNWALFKIFQKLSKRFDLRLCVVNLVDSIYLTSPSKYISILLLSLRSMMMMDLPQINVISKIDMLANYGNKEDLLPFRLDYYTEVQQLEYLQPLIEIESENTGYKYTAKKLSKLTQHLSEIIEDYNLVTFEVLSIDDKNSMVSLQTLIDKSNGYIFGVSEIGGDTIWSELTRQGIMNELNMIDIQERWIDNKDEYDKEEERKRQEAIKQKELLDKEVNIQENNIDGNEDGEWERVMKDWENATGKVANTDQPLDK